VPLDSYRASDEVEPSQDDSPAQAALCRRSRPGPSVGAVGHSGQSGHLGNTRSAEPPTLLPTIPNKSMNQTLRHFAEALPSHPALPVAGVTKS
jgi:hypothetical protein